MRSVILLLLPALAGCPSQSADAGPTEPRDRSAPVDPQVTVELTARPLQGGDDGGGRVSAQGVQGAIAVQGALSTPTPCYTLSGTARRAESIVTLTVEARSRDGMCVQSIGAFAYDAAVRGLPAGTYSFRVVHTYPGTGWESRGALETQVTVR